MSVILPKTASVDSPNSGKVRLFANSNGLISLKDSDGNIREYQPTPLESESMVYGVRWDSVNDTMQPGIISGGSFVATDYQNYPVQEKMGRGLLTGTGSWTKLNPYDTSKLEDGSSATIDGSSGQVMVKVPRHYQLVITDGDYKYILVSEFPFSFNGSDAWIPPAFLDSSNFYVGAFQGVALTDSNSANVGSCVKDTSGYSTNSYPNPYSDQTRGDFRTYCSNTGAVFNQYSYGMHTVLYVLAVTEFKTWDVQSIIEGHTERASFVYSETSQAGETVNLGDFSGSIYSDTDSLYIANSYRGIENIFGNVWYWVDGINIDTDDDQRVWVAYDPSNFADDTTTNYTDTGHAPGWDDIDNYIKDIVGSGKHIPLYASELNNGADSSSYITDYFWSAALGSGWRVAKVGGRSNVDRRAGIGSLNSHNTSSTSSSGSSVRLAAYI